MQIGLRVAPLMMVILFWSGPGIQADPEDAISADNSPGQTNAEQQAYLMGPAIYIAMIEQIEGMDSAGVVGTLMENGRQITALPEIGRLKVDRPTDDGGFEDMKTIGPLGMGRVGLLPHEIYNRAGLENSINNLLQNRYAGDRADAITALLADIFERGPREGARIARQLRSGTIQHPAAMTLALDWMTDVGVWTDDPAVAGTMAAWMRDPVFRQQREAENTRLPPRETEIAISNRLLVMLQNNPAYTGRGLLVCLLDQHDLYPDQDYLQRLRYHILSNMRKWDAKYPRKELDRLRDKFGFLGRIAVRMQMTNTDKPVGTDHLPTDEINMHRCPYLGDNALE